MFKKILVLFGKKEKIIFSFAVLLTFLATFAEIVSLGSLVPLVIVLINPEKLSLISYINTEFIFNLKYNFKLFFLFIFIGAIFFSICMRMSVLAFNIYLARSAGNAVSTKIFEKVLNSGLGSFSKLSSQEIYSLMTNKTDVFVEIIRSYMELSVSLLMLSSILIVLLFINYEITIIIFVIFLLFYVCVILLVRKKSFNYGKMIATMTTEKFKFLTEGLEGFKYIILNNLQLNYTSNLKKIDFAARNANGNIKFIMQMPRLVLEGLAIATMLVIVFYFDATKQYDVSILIAISASMAFAAQRLLPIIQQIYGSFIYIKSNKNSLKDILYFLNNSYAKLKKKKMTEITFNKSIKIKNGNFSFTDKKIHVFKNLNIEFKKNKVVGIVGSSGSGKTVLTDIIIGLRNLNKGQITVDNATLDNGNIMSWRKKISHVPQNVFTINDTVLRNVCLGMSDANIDLNKVRNVIKKASLNKELTSMKSGLNTIVSSRASNFSTGQIQRIGFARALYKNPDILIFDEPTSALDLKTEKKLIEVIKKIKLNKTIIITTHRNKPLEVCDEIYKIVNKKIKRIK